MYWRVCAAAAVLGPLRSLHILYVFVRCMMRIVYAGLLCVWVCISMCNQALANSVCIYTHVQENQ